MPFAVRIDPHLRDQRRCIKVYLVLCDILPACQTADFPYLMPAFSRPELFFHVCFGKSSAFVAFLPESVQRTVGGGVLDGTRFSAGRYPVPDT